MKDLFDLAYKFRNSKVWKAFYEDEVFAVTLPDGQIGYCYIMGRSGEHMALSVHIGGEGFTTYRKIKELNRFTAPSEALMIQDCIQCSIEKKDMLSVAGQRPLQGAKHTMTARTAAGFPLNRATR